MITNKTRLFVHANIPSTGNNQLVNQIMTAVFDSYGYRTLCMCVGEVDGKDSYHLTLEIGARISTTQLNHMRAFVKGYIQGYLHNIQHSI